MSKLTVCVSEGYTGLRYWKSHAVKALAMANTISMSLHASHFSIICKESWHEWKPPESKAAAKYDPSHASLMDMRALNQEHHDTPLI